METVKIPLLIHRLARLCRRGENPMKLVREYGLTNEEQEMLKMVLETGKTPCSNQQKKPS